MTDRPRRSGSGARSTGTPIGEALGVPYESPGTWKRRVAGSRNSRPATGHLGRIPIDWLSGLRGRAVVDPCLTACSIGWTASREPSLPAMDPDFTYSMSDLDRIHDRDEWTRIHRS